MEKKVWLRRGLVICVVLMATVLLPLAHTYQAQAADQPAGKKIPVTIATKGPGSQDHVLYSAYATIINKYSNAVSVSLAPSAGSTVSVQLMAKAQVDIGDSASWDAQQAYYGKGIWEKAGPQPIRTIFNSYKSQVTLWSRPDIKTGADFKGKKLMIKRPNVPLFNLLAHEVPRYYGLEPGRDYVEQPVASTEACAQALIEGRTDSYFSHIGGSHMYELKKTVGVNPLVIPKEVLDYLIKKGFPVYFSKVPSSLAKDIGLPADYQALTYNDIFMCRETLSPEVVYEITKVLFENYKERAAIHPKAAEADLEFALFEPPIPFHEGAIKYFKEKGVWTEKLDSFQKNAPRPKK